MTIVLKERPGVEVTQEFVTPDVEIQSAALPACIVGPAFEVVEAVEDDGSLNASAQVALPALIPFSWVSSPFQYASLGGTSLFVEVNNAAEAEIEMGGTASASRTATQVVDDINEAAITGLSAYLETSGSQQRAVIRTILTGDFASLLIGASTDAAINTAFGTHLGQSSTGRIGYHNYTNFVVGRPNYPDPRDNLDDLTIDYETARVFIATGGGSTKEVLRTEGLLTGGVSAVTVTDDGDGDNLSPYLSFAGANFRAAAATMTGTVDLTTLVYGVSGTFDPALTFRIGVEGGSQTLTTLNSGLANAAAIVTAINTAMGATVASLNGSNQLVLTSTVAGYLSKLELGTSATATATTVLGFSYGQVATGSPSMARALGTVDLTGLTYASDVQGRILRMGIDGGDFQTITFSTGVTNAATLVAALVALWGSGAARLTGGNKLELNSVLLGLEGIIRIDKDVSDSTLLTNLGLTTSGAPFETLNYVRGSAFPVVVGDEIWVDGLRIGLVTGIPVGYTNRLRLDSEKALTYAGSSWFLVAKGLDNAVQTTTRPGSTLLVDEASGTVKIQDGVFYDVGGRPTNVGPSLVYLAYTALRLDIAANGRSSVLQRSGSLSEIQTLYSPIDTQNPFGLGMYMAKLASGTLEVTGIAVNETSDSEPEGTADGYAAAFEYLESKDVYSIVPLTQALIVAQLGQIHVNTMSLPENGQERILLINLERPERMTDTLIASGPTANVSGVPTNDVATGLSDLALLLAAADLPGPSYTEDDGVYLVFENDTNKYLVESISGGVVTINDGPMSSSTSPFFDAAGADVFTTAIVDRPFSIKVLGADLVNLTDEAEAYSDLGRVFADRRVVLTAPDTGVTSIDGLATAVPGFYMNCVLAGVISNKKASDPLTETILPAFTAVVGSNDRYGETQLKMLCGGGVWVFYNDNGVSVKTRHQLTTDTTGIKQQELSITTALDYGAKVFRMTMKTFIGNTNLTQNVQDSVGMVAQGFGAFVTDAQTGVYKSFEIVALTASATAPDELGIIADIGVFFPLNKIRATFRA